MVAVDDELPQPIAGHNIARIKCLQIHAITTMRVVRSVCWGILTACTLVLRLADTVSMDERGGPQCFSLGSRKAPNIQPRSNHFIHASSSGGAVPVGVV